jgi:uncharacterized repeat protein (TIGR03803 family)
VHEFATDEGTSPLGGLIQGNDGSLYGTTRTGGPSGFGTIFKVTTGGVLTVLHSFAVADGTFPTGVLVQATDGNLYGIAFSGGDVSCSYGGYSGCGTVFSITPGGTFTTLHSFDRTDGMWPYAGLVQGTDGNLYGTTSGDVGLHLFGTVFKMSLGLAPFVKTVPVAAYPGKQIFILGNNLTGATSVSFNGTAASFTVVSATEITATVPVGSTTGTVVVTAPGGSLASNVAFRVF